MTDPATEATQRALGVDVVEIELYRHQPVLSMHDGSMKGCQCLDRVFYNDHEDWGSHLAEVCAVHMTEAAREALTPIQVALSDWYAKYISVLAGPGANVRSEMVCMDALAEIGLLVGWEAPDGGDQR